MKKFYAEKSTLLSCELVGTKLRKVGGEEALSYLRGPDGDESGRLPISRDLVRPVPLLGPQSPLVRLLLVENHI